MEVHKSGMPCFFMLIPTIKYYTTLNDIIYIHVYPGLTSFIHVQ